MNPRPHRHDPWQNRKGLFLTVAFSRLALLLPPLPFFKASFSTGHLLFNLQVGLVSLNLCSWSARWWTNIAEWIQSEFATLPCQIHSKIPNYGLLIFFLIHKPHQFTQIIWEMFGKGTQFLSKAITHITSKQNKKYICGRFVSHQKDRGSLFSSLHNESYIISSLSVGQYEELLPSFLWGRGGPIVGSILRVEVFLR